MNSPLIELPLPSLVRYHRRRAGLSQIALATLAGVSRKVVQDLEAGQEGIAWRHLKALLAVLNISLRPEGPLIAEWRRLQAAADGAENPAGDA